MTVMTKEFVASCTNEAIEVKLYGVMNERRAVGISEKSGGKYYYGGYNLPPLIEIELGYLLKWGGGGNFPLPSCFVGPDCTTKAKLTPCVLTDFMA